MDNTDSRIFKLLQLYKSAGPRYQHQPHPLLAQLRGFDPKRIQGCWKDVFEECGRSYHDRGEVDPSDYKLIANAILRYSEFKRWMQRGATIGGASKILRRQIKRKAVEHMF